MGLRTRTFAVTLFAGVLIGLGILSGLTGCESSKQPGVDISIGEVKSRLEEAGEEPRRELRYAFEEAWSQDATMKMTMTTTAMGQTVETPTMSFPCKAKMLEVTPEGVGKFSMKFGEIELSGGQPGMVAAMQPAMAGFDGVDVISTIDALGHNLGSEVNIPDGTPEELRQTLDSMKDSMANMEAPFPAEPVGVGAKWDLSTTVTSQGMEIDQVATYTLESIEGDVIKIGIVIKQSADAQSFDLPGINAQASLEKYSGSGTGSMTIDLRSPIPTSTMTLDASMTMKVQGQTSSMQMSMEMELIPQ